jgi:hypothetical protein
MNIFSRIVYRTVLFMAILVALQLVGLYTSFDSFIRPLEKAADDLRVGRGIIIIIIIIIVIIVVIVIIIIIIIIIVVVVVIILGIHVCMSTF